MVRVTKALIAKLQNMPKTADEMDSKELEAVLKAADKAYHSGGIPIFSDHIYDSLRSMYERMAGHAYEAIGAAPKSKKVKLPYFMGSMDKIKGDDKDLNSFLGKCKAAQFIVEDKLDGVSALLYVHQGNVKLFTRGDGNVGQDISHLIAKIKGVPPVSELARSANENGGELTVRGELIISKSDFHKISHKGANARNIVSGTVNAKTHDLETCSMIVFMAYTLIHPNVAPSAQLLAMQSYGFNVVYNTTVYRRDMNTQRLSELLVQRREHSPFEVDGTIVIEDAVHELEMNKNPSYAFAFKNIITQESAEVTVVNVDWNVSKDGYMVPVVEFDPVKLSGVMVKRASGFNGEFINNNKIGPGSRIIVTRSGDVIPYIVSILSASATGRAQLPDLDFTWTETGKDIIQVGRSDSLDQRVLENFFAKLDVPGLKAGTVKKLYNAGFKNVKQIVGLSVEDLLEVDGFQGKSATTLVDAIHAKMATLGCLELMDASNAFGRGFAQKRLKMIIDRFPEVISGGSYVPPISELLDVDGVSDKTANAFILGLAKYRQFLKDAGIACVQTVHTVKPMGITTGVTTTAKNKFAGHVVVFTGFRNAAVQEFIISNGGEVSDSVTKKTTMVLTKDTSSTSTKIEKAQKNGAAVMAIEDFKRLHGL